MINDATFLTTINTIPNPLVVTNGEEILLSNRSFLDFLGVDSLSELKSYADCICSLFVEHSDYFSEKDLKEDENWIEYIETHQEGIKVSMLNSGGEGRAFEVSIGKLEEYNNTYVVIFTDITSLQNEKLILEKLVYKDPLTNIFNRQIFNVMLQQAFNDKRRNGDALSLIMFDIDHFKKVNDTYGHDVGDKVLIELTKLISSQIRSSDIFARWGGEEFMILLAKTGLEAAYKKAEFLRKTVEEFALDFIPKITISLGVVEILEEDKERSCFKRVDKALYKAKETRNRTVKLTD